MSSPTNFTINTHPSKTASTYEAKVFPQVLYKDREDYFTIDSNVHTTFQLTSAHFQKHIFVVLRSQSLTLYLPDIIESHGASIYMFISNTHKDSSLILTGFNGTQQINSVTLGGYQNNGLTTYTIQNPTIGSYGKLFCQGVNWSVDYRDNKMNTIEENVTGVDTLVVVPQKHNNQIILLKNLHTRTNFTVILPDPTVSTLNNCHKFRFITEPGENAISDTISFSIETTYSPNVLGIEGELLVHGTGTTIMRKTGTGLVPEQIHSFQYLCGGNSDSLDITFEVLNLNTNCLYHLTGLIISNSIDLRVPDITNFLPVGGAGNVINFSYPVHFTDNTELDYTTNPITATILNNGSFATIKKSFFGDDIYLAGSCDILPITDDTVSVGTSGNRLKAIYSAIVNANAINMSGNIDMGGTNKIINLANPAASSDAVNLSYLNTSLSSYLPKSGGTMSGAINMGGFTISSCGGISGSATGLLTFTSTSLHRLGETLWFSSATIAYMANTAYTASVPINFTLSTEPSTTTVRLNCPLSGSVRITEVGTNDLAVFQLAGVTIYKSLSMNTVNRIINLANPVNPQDAVTLNYLTTNYVPLSTLSSYLPLAGGTMTGAIDMGFLKIQGLADPFLSSDAVNLGYLNTQLSSYLTTASASSTYATITSLANYLQLAGGTMTGTLNMGTQLITGLASPGGSSDAVNLSYLSTNYLTQSSASSTYMPLAGGTFTGNVSHGTNNITAIGSITSTAGALTFTSFAVPQRLGNLYVDGSGSTTLTLHNPNNVTAGGIAANYVMSSTDIGATRINCSSGKTITFSTNNGTTISTFAGTGVSFSVSVSCAGIIGTGALTFTGGSNHTIGKWLSVTSGTTGLLVNPVLTPATSFALSQTNVGDTVINCAVAKTVSINVNSSTTLASFSLSGSNINTSLNMGSNLITSVANPVSPQDAVTLNYLTTNYAPLSSLSNYLPLAGGTMSGILNMGSLKIQALADPTVSGDAVNLGYLNTQLSSYLTTATASSTYMPLAGGTFTGNVSHGTNNITAVGSVTSTSGTLSFSSVSALHRIGTFQSSSSGNIAYLTHVANGGSASTSFAFGYDATLGGVTRINGPTSSTITLSINDTTTVATFTAGQINFFKWLSMNSLRIINVDNPVNPQDAVTLNYLTTNYAPLSSLSNYLPLAGGTMSGTLNMGTQLITGLASPGGSTDAVNLSYLSTNYLTQSSAAATYLPLAGGTMSGILNMGSLKIQALADPTLSADAVNLGYLNTQLSSYLTTASASSTYMPLAGGTFSGNVSHGTNNITAIGSITSTAGALSFTTNATPQRLGNLYVDGSGSTTMLLHNPNNAVAGGAASNFAVSSTDVGETRINCSNGRGVTIAVNNGTYRVLVGVNTATFNVNIVCVATATCRLGLWLFVTSATTTAQLVNNAFSASTATDWSFASNVSGDTSINCTTGRSMIFGINGSQIATFNATNFTPTTTPINLGQNSTTTWTNVYGVNAYTATSDRRLKKDVIPLATQEDRICKFIETLQPVSYIWKTHCELCQEKLCDCCACVKCYNATNTPTVVEEEEVVVNTDVDMTEEEGLVQEGEPVVKEEVPMAQEEVKKTPPPPDLTRHSGFIAQDCKDAADAAGVDVSGMVQSTFVESTGVELFNLKYSEMIPMLVQYCQSLNNRIKTLETTIAQLSASK